MNARAGSILTRSLLAVAVLLAAASLVAGIGGGLARFGVVAAPSIAVAHHGALMTCGFFGTLITLERVVALRTGFALPLVSGLGTVLLLAGANAAGGWAWLVAGLGLVGLYLYAGVRRAWSLHLGVEACGAACWPIGTLAWMQGDGGAATLAWSAFLLLTIAGERRELAQFVRIPSWARALFVVAVATVLAAVLWRLADPVREAASRMLWWGGAAALALWLLRFDLALRKWRAEQWVGHTARCLVVGYAWLLVACALQATPAAVASLHALLLGFVFAMVFGHAPIMLPALAGIRPRYTPAAQWPLWLMAASLVLRIVGVWTSDAGWLHAAAVGHAAAIVLFALAMGYAALRGGRSAAQPGRPSARGVPYQRE